MDIPGSPFQFTVGPLQDGGAHCVHAGGSGLEQGVSGQAAEFNVWTREAGPGSLAISVEGPSKAQIDFKDRKDGSCYVSYVVDEPGEYFVGIKFNDDHIPLSPYKVVILPTSDHADKVLVTNLDSVVSNTPQSFLLHKNGADGNLECAMVSPSGREDDCFISHVGQDEYSVRFVPKEEGTHHLHAKLNGVHVPGSPFKINVGNTTKDGSVMVYGNGIDKVHIGEKASFIIDTTSVGAGTLSVTVDGPSKVDMDCIEVKQGYQVSYTPTVPGDYFVTVKYNGHNVEGSPFNVTATGGGIVAARAKITETRRESSSVTMETIQHTAMTSQVTRAGNQRSIPVQPSFVSDASKVVCEGEGIDHPVLGKQNSFHVDCSRAGSNVLFVGVFGPENPCDEVYVKHLGDKQYGVKYKLKQKGQYILYVKWGDEHISGSPFHVQV
jgi:filamin